MSLRARLAGALVAALVAVGVVGCADEQPPGDVVPALAQHLEGIDAAIEGGDLEQARALLDGLAAETIRARDAGELDADDADAILAAAHRLLSGLPAPTTTAPPATEPPPDDDDDDDDKDDDDNGEGKGGRGGGNGPSGGNGPDDGHGN